jgi:hypothetical protein
MKRNISVLGRGDVGMYSRLRRRAACPHPCASHILALIVHTTKERNQIVK